MITQAPSAKPKAKINPGWVATVEYFKPGLGRRMARQTRLLVLNDPGFQVDQVVDALQRYLGLSPRREPAADPRAEASAARHPQGLLQARQRWLNDTFRQFIANGVMHHQIRPVYRTWGGNLELTIRRPGQATVSAPPARTARPVAPRVSLPGNFDPAFAAQENMRRQRELMGEPDQAVPPFTLPQVGPPLWTDDPYFDSAYAAQNAVAYLAQLLRPSEDRWIRVGPPNKADDPYFDPINAARNVVSRLQADLGAGGQGGQQTGGGAADGRLARLLRAGFSPSPPALSSWT